MERGRRRGWEGMQVGGDAEKWGRRRGRGGGREERGERVGWSKGGREDRTVRR